MSKPAEIVNFYEKIPKKYFPKRKNDPNYKSHGIKQPFRMIIYGASGSGKSNTLMNIIKFLNFDTIHLITKNKNEPLYNYLNDVCEKNKFDFTISEGIETVPELDSFDNQYNNLVIFDDMINEDKKNQKSIEDYYTRCRKLGISACYLSQSWYKIPDMIRKNTNYIIIKKIGSAREIKMMMSDYSFGINSDELLQIYKFCTNDYKNFLLIDVDAPMESKFRKNFEILKLDFEE